MSFSVPSTDAPTPPLRRGPAVLAYLLVMLAIPAGFLLGEEASSFAAVGVLYVPFTLLALLAYLGQRSTAAKVLALIWLLFLFMGIAFGVLGTAAGAYSGAPLTDPEAAASADLGRVLRPVSQGVLIALIPALLVFLPVVRRGLARLLPIDPHSFVHTVALSVILAVTCTSFIPLLVFGAPPLLTEAFMKLAEESGALEEQSNLLSTVYTLVWAIPVAILAVGYGVRRSFQETLQRLGFVRPTARQIGIGAAAAVALVVGVNILDLGIGWLWESLGWARTDAEAFSELIAFAFNPLGAVVLAISAGVGEELGVRGVLQPRLGILLSNLFFTSLHAFQYNWDALLVVFLIGLVFGVLRKYTNTTTSALAHALYDFILVMLAIYGVSVGS